MKKIYSIILLITLLSTLAFGVYAVEPVEEGEMEDIVSPQATYPPCPNDSNHSGRYFSSISSTAHKVYCAECSATIISSQAHSWVEGSCTTDKYCTLCSFVSVPAPGHIPYPSSTYEMVSVSSEKHGHTCQRGGCIYNPSTPGYSYYGLVIPSMPNGPHVYYDTPSYTSYAHATTGDWWHKKIEDCSYCNYVKESFFQCSYHDQSCNGGCD